MSYILKYTATRDTWNSVVKKGETFIVEQNQTFAGEAFLKKHLESLGREISNYSSISAGNLNIGEVKTRNEWIIERIK